MEVKNFDRVITIPPNLFFFSYIYEQRDSSTSFTFPILSRDRSIFNQFTQMCKIRVALLHVRTEFRSYRNDFSTSLVERGIREEELINQVEKKDYIF